MMKFPNRMEQLRSASGYTREELAQLCGVTRQAIGLMEAGKVSPSTVVALRLARALKTTVEEIFRDPLEESLVDISVHDTLGPEVGSAFASSPSIPLRAFVGSVNGNVLARPATDAALANVMRPADAMVEPVGQYPGKGRLTWFQGSEDPLQTLFVSGCDAGLGLLTGYLSKLNHGIQGVWFEVPNSAALRELARGHTHVAAVHEREHLTPDLRSKDKSAFVGAEHLTGGSAIAPRLASTGAPQGVSASASGVAPGTVSGSALGDMLRITFAQAEIGWMVRKGDRQRFAGADSLRGGQWNIVNRPVGAGVRTVFDELLKSSGVQASEVKGYSVEVRGHLAVAEAVAQGLADTGLGHAGAAALFGLDFIPVQRETCTLMMPTTYLSHPGVQSMLQTLNSDRFRTELQRFGPYDVSHTGTSGS